MIQCDSRLASLAMSAPALVSGFDAGDGEAQLEAAFGGASGLMDFMDRGTPEEIQYALSLYGVGYIDHRAMDHRVDPSSVDEEANADHASRGGLEGCPRVFAGEYRNAWHEFDGERYRVDSSGRPQAAVTTLPPIVEAKRSGRCQAQVGKWGDDESRSTRYQGGHFIAAREGGWRARLNLAPQDESLNHGDWERIEMREARCTNLPEHRLQIRVEVAYRDERTLIPATFSRTLTDLSTGKHETLVFFNTAEGGGHGRGDKEVARGKAFLEEIGCGKPGAARPSSRASRSDGPIKTDAAPSQPANGPLDGWRGTLLYRMLRALSIAP